MLNSNCMPTIETIATIPPVAKPAAMFSRKPIPRVRTMPAIAFIGCTASGYPNHAPARILAIPVKTKVVAKSIAPTCARAIRIGSKVPKSPRLPEISPKGFDLRWSRFHLVIEAKDENLLSLRSCVSRVSLARSIEEAKNHGCSGGWSRRFCDLMRDPLTEMRPQTVTIEMRRFRTKNKPLHTPLTLTELPSLSPETSVKCHFHLF